MMTFISLALPLGCSLRPSSINCPFFLRSVITSSSLVFLSSSLAVLSSQHTHVPHFLDFLFLKSNFRSFSSYPVKLRTFIVAFTTLFPVHSLPPMSQHCIAVLVLPVSCSFFLNLHVHSSPKTFQVLVSTCVVAIVIVVATAAELYS